MRSWQKLLRRFGGLGFYVMVLRGALRLLIAAETRVCIPRAPARRNAEAFTMQTRGILSAVFKSQRASPAQECTARTEDSVLIPVCRTPHDFAEATRLLEQMKEQGLKPNAACYPIILEGACKFGTPDEILLIFNEMKASGSHPGVQARSSMISSLVKAGMFEQASKVFQDFRDMKKVDSTLYSTMIWSQCQADRSKEAETFLKLMHEDGLGTDDICYNVVLSAYERAGAFGDCIRIFGDMKKRGCNVGPSTNSLMLNVYLKAGHFWDFDKLFKKMQKGGMFGYSGMIEKMIDFYASTTRSRDAELLYNYTRRNSITIRLDGYNKLMELFVNADNPSMVERIYRELPTRGHVPDGTSKRWLLRAYLRANCIDKAFELHGQMVKEGWDLDRLSSQLMLEAYVKAGKMFEATALAAQMKESDIPVDEELYKSVKPG